MVTNEALLTAPEILAPTGLRREVLIDAVDSALRWVGPRDLMRLDDAHVCVRIVTDATFGDVVPEVREFEELVRRIVDGTTPVTPLADALLDLRLKLRSPG